MHQPDAYSENSNELGGRHWPRLIGVVGSSLGLIVGLFAFITSLIFSGDSTFILGGVTVAISAGVALVGAMTAKTTPVLGGLLMLLGAFFLTAFDYEILRSGILFLSGPILLIASFAAFAKRTPKTTGVAQDADRGEPERP